MNICERTPRPVSINELKPIWSLSKFWKTTVTVRLENQCDTHTEKNVQHQHIAFSSTQGSQANRKMSNCSYTVVATSVKTKGRKRKKKRMKQKEENEEKKNQRKKNEGKKMKAKKEKRMKKKRKKKESSE